MTGQPLFMLKSNQYIEDPFYKFKNSFFYELIPAREIALVPDGCVEFIWNMNKKKLYCLEYIDERVVLDAVGERLFGVHLDSFYSCSYNREELEAFFQKLEEFSSFRKRCSYCSTQINRVLCMKKAPPLVQKAMERMKEANGKAAVEVVAAEFDYTARHMERLFLQMLPYGPKRFCQYIRLREVICNMAEFPEQNIASFMEHAGYSDQSHFQREFKSFTDMTPKQFMKKYLSEN